MSKINKIDVEKSDHDAEATHSQRLKHSIERRVAAEAKLQDDLNEFQDVLNKFAQRMRAMKHQR